MKSVQHYGILPVSLLTIASKELDTIIAELVICTIKDTYAGKICKNCDNNIESAWVEIICKNDKKLIRKLLQITRNGSSIWVGSTIISGRWEDS